MIIHSSKSRWARQIWVWHTSNNRGSVSEALESFKLSNCLVPLPHRGAWNEEFIILPVATELMLKLADIDWSNEYPKLGAGLALTGDFPEGLTPAVAKGLFLRDSRAFTLPSVTINHQDFLIIIIIITVKG